VDLDEDGVEPAQAPESGTQSDLCHAQIGAVDKPLGR